MTTMSGDIGRAYRRDLPTGAKGQTVNVGGPTARPEGAGQVAVEVAEGRRSGHSSQNWRKASARRRAAGIGEELECADTRKGAF